MSGPSSAHAAAPRWRAACLLAVVTAAHASIRGWIAPTLPSDFDQLWHAANELLAGGDPYSAVGPGQEFQWDWPLYYPLPAVLIAAPFAILPVAFARIAFSTLSAGILGWAMGARVRTHWPLLVSASYILATSRAQWSALLLAAAWIPWLGVVIAAKPNVGLAVMSTVPRRGLLPVLWGIGLVLGLSMAVMPDWLQSWKAAVATAPHIVAPITKPGGFILALAITRWRLPEARLLLVLALVPHTPSLYDLVPLFFICRTLRESLVLALLTHLLFWAIVAWGPYASFEAYTDALGTTTVFLVFIPALVVVLLRGRETTECPAAPHRTHSPPGSGLRQLPRIDMGLLACAILSSALLVWLPLAGIVTRNR